MQCLLVISLCWLIRFVRLETLEGIAAFLRQDLPAAQASLQSALANWERLQVDDQALAMLAGMGLTATEVSSNLHAIVTTARVTFVMHSSVYQLVSFVSAAGISSSKFEGGKVVGVACFSEPGPTSSDGCDCCLLEV